MQAPTRRRLLTAFAASAGLGACQSFDPRGMDIGKLIQGVTAIGEGASLGESDEIAMGDKYYATLVAQSGGAYGNARAQTALRRFAQPLLATSARKAFRWEVTLVDDDTVNAWALPGGKLAVNKGLLRYVADEAELAAVIAHEIGHAELSHTIGAVRSKKIGAGLANLASGALAGAGGVAQGLFDQLQGPVFELVTQGYSREDERAADQHILAVFARTGHDPARASHVFRTLLQLVPEGSEGTSSLFSTHPGTRERIANLDAAAKTARRGGASPTGARDAFAYLKSVFPTRAHFRRQGVA